MKPFKANLAGVTYLVRFDKTKSGGLSDLNNKVITIGTAIPSEVRETILHEFYETILHERGHRYVRYEEGNDGVRFFLSHHDFENVIKDMLIALKSFPG